MDLQLEILLFFSNLARGKRKISNTIIGNTLHDFQ
jgi:hypothetical protein